MVAADHSRCLPISAEYWGHGFPVRASQASSGRAQLGCMPRSDREREREGGSSSYDLNAAVKLQVDAVHGLVVEQKEHALDDVLGHRQPARRRLRGHRIDYRIGPLR